MDFASANDKIHPINEIAAHLYEIRGRRPSLQLAAERSPKGQQAVVSILAATRSVFMRKGHANLTLRMVAEEAGIALGNISYYFPTKKQLIDAMLREQMVDYVEEHLRLLENGSQSPLELLLDTIEFYVTASRSSYQFFFETWAYAGSDEDAKALVSELYRAIGLYVYRLIRATRPELDHEEINRIVLQISSLTQGLSLFIAIDLGDNPALRTVERDVRDLVRRIVCTA